MTLSPMAKVVPNFWNIRSSLGLIALLQVDIQRTGAKSAAVHRAEHLNVAHRIEAEPAGDALLDEFDEPRDGNIRFGSRDEVKIRRILRSREIRHLSAIDLV